jgi:hypothetical protein
MLSTRSLSDVVKRSLSAPRASDLDERAELPVGRAVLNMPMLET